MLVCADDPAKLEGEIAQLSSIADYDLLAGVSHWIRDSYWDRADEALQRGRLALRVRQIDGEVLLALKGEEHPTATGVDRLEVEGPWSADILARVTNRLGWPPLGEAALGLEERDPSLALPMLGFHVVQQREAYRRARPIVSHGRADGSVLAELAIDDVTYRLGLHSVRLHEIELEAKGAQHGSVVDRIARAMLRQFGSGLQAWPFGKLATGRAIDQLMKAGALRGFLDDQTNLKREAYAKIRDHLLREEA